MNMGLNHTFSFPFISLSLPASLLLSSFIVFPPFFPLQSPFFLLFSSSFIYYHPSSSSHYYSPFISFPHHSTVLHSSLYFHPSLRSSPFFIILCPSFSSITHILLTYPSLFPHFPTLFVSFTFPFHPPLLFLFLHFLSLNLLYLPSIFFLISFLFI